MLRHDLLLECLEHTTFDFIIYPGAQFKEDNETEVRFPPRTCQFVTSLPSKSPTKPKFSHSPIRTSETGELPGQQDKKGVRFLFPEISRQCKSRYKRRVQNETFSEQMRGLQTSFKSDTCTMAYITVKYEIP